MSFADFVQPVRLRVLGVAFDEAFGCRLRAALSRYGRLVFHIRRIVVCRKPVAPAIGRIDQWVASLGADATTCAKAASSRASPDATLSYLTGVERTIAWVKRVRVGDLRHADL